MQFYFLFKHEMIPSISIHHILVVMQIFTPISLKYTQIHSQYLFLSLSPFNASDNNDNTTHLNSTQISTRDKQSLSFLFPVRVSVSVIESCGIGTSSFQRILFNLLSQRVICTPYRFPPLTLLIALDIGCDMRFGRKRVSILWRFRRWHYDMRSDLFAKAFHRLRSLRQFYVQSGVCLECFECRSAKTQISYIPFVTEKTAVRII